MKIKFLFLFFCAIYLSACVNRRYDEEYIPKPVNYAVVQNSVFFNKKNISFSIDSLNKTLYLELTINGLIDFPFPVNQKHKDTLCKTAFDFYFYCNNKIITSEYPVFKNTFHFIRSNSIPSGNLHLSTDTIDIRNFNKLAMQIPFYAFHSLKRGKQTIELIISQTIFTNDSYSKDSSGNHYRLYELKPLLNTKIKFEINVPPIYKSIIYGQGLELRNDSASSPLGMDNTLWNSSYPDIYWTINYPKNMYYAQTPFEPSTDKYVAHDTFNLYHYYLNDSVGFGVYDHDWLSSDDWMGSWWGSLNDLEKRDYKRLKFDNIHHFDLKVVDAGEVN